MKTRNLTAKEAENLLACGLTDFIEYENEYFHNVYCFHKGMFYSLFHKGRPSSGSKPSTYPDNRGFKVVNMPTYQPTLLPFWMRERLDSY